MLRLRSSGPHFARVALPLTLKVKVLEDRCCPQSSHSGPHLPWMFYEECVPTLVSHRPGQLQDHQGTQPGSHMCLNPHGNAVLEGMTSLHPSSQKPFRQLAPISIRAPGKLCLEEESPARKVTPEGGAGRPEGDALQSTASLSRPGPNTVRSKVRDEIQESCFIAIPPKSQQKYIL